MRISKSILISIIALILLIGSCTTYSLLRPESPWARAQARLSAEQRWSQRSFGNYHLELTDKHCLFSMDIHNERIQKIEPQRCEAPPRSITDLFTLIKRDGQISQPCIYLGCACDDRIYVDAQYHTNLGYPQHITVYIRAEPNYWHSAYWQYVWNRRQAPPCDNLMEGSKLIEVLSVQPQQ